MAIMIIFYVQAARCDKRALEIDSSTPESAFAVFFFFIHIIFFRWKNLTTDHDQSFGENGEKN